MSDPNSIQGKVALVAGGAKNLGGLISLDMAAHGAKAVVVHFNSDSTKKDAEETAVGVKKSGAECLLIQADLTKVKECTRLFDEAIKAFGQVDIAINTTGMVIKKPIVDVTEEDYDQIFAVNSKAAFFSFKRQARSLRNEARFARL